jgi:hypothetical protein
MTARSSSASWVRRTWPWAESAASQALRPGGSCEGDSALPKLARSQDAYDRFSRAVDLPLSVLALILLAVLIVPLTVSLPDTAVHTLDVTDYVIWAVFAVEYLVRFYLAPLRLRFVTRNLVDLAVVAVPLLRSLARARVVPPAWPGPGGHCVRRRSPACSPDAGPQWDTAIRCRCPLAGRGGSPDAGRDRADRRADGYDRELLRRGEGRLAGGRPQRAAEPHRGTALSRLGPAGPARRRRRLRRISPLTGGRRSVVLVNDFDIWKNIVREFSEELP